MNRRICQADGWPGGWLARPKDGLSQLAALRARKVRCARGDRFVCVAGGNGLDTWQLAMARPL